ncbi:MAG: gliding motility lipoprotein GldJ [Bacteroidales bacterium]|nr:gliding motility lipoprotein GldJ [Bacteroidales bacterium]
MKNKFHLFWLVVFGAMIFASCQREASNTTGWYYNDPRFGGFQNHPGYEQETGPGLIFVEGGTFAMGRTEQDVMFQWNNSPRRVTVSSFYMDETEIRNIDYREYLYWLRKVYATDFRYIYRSALPDTLIWRERLAFNEPMVELYLRHPAYEEYPVVGVSWVQARDYSSWRTDRVNEFILIREGILDPYAAPQDQAKHFNLDSYLTYADNLDLHIDETGRGPDGKVENLYVDPSTLKEGRRGQSAYEENRRWVSLEDGIFLPRYRLPTEAEWEYAALAYIGNHYKERIYERRLYPWNGHYIRNDSRTDDRGQIMANVMRGRGDNMGVAGALNDGADIPAPVRSYWPNDFGLYCMAGNVNEWVMDVYRDVTFEDMAEFRPFRGNVYTEKQIVRDPNDGMVELTAEAEDYFDITGKILTKPVDEEHCFNRDNYTRADNRNYLDGDLNSLIPEGGTGWWNDGARLNQFTDVNEDSIPKLNTTGKMYNEGNWDGTDWGKGRFDSNNPKTGKGTGMTSLVTNRSRVYKGGGWNDRAFWMTPGSRRYLDEKKGQANLGFRCAMIRVGSQTLPE